jgi:transcriptional regulator with XRE-family HTH domain
MKKKTTVESLAQNLTLLMQLTNMKKPELSRKSGVSPRMIAYILNAERRATIETVDDLAKVFGLEGWHLIMPSLPKDLKTSKALQRLVENYIESSGEGRGMIDMVAEREAKYGVD